MVRDESLFTPCTVSGFLVGMHPQVCSYWRLRTVVCCERPRIQPHSRQVSHLRNLSVLELRIKGKDSSYKSSGHPNSLNSTQVLLDKYMLAGPVSHAAGTCQHCLWPGEQRRDSFQGVSFPYPFIIYLPGHKSVFPCSCKASAYGSSVFRKVFLCTTCVNLLCKSFLKI